MAYCKEMETLRSERFWEDKSCHVAAGGLAFVESGDGCVIFQTSGSTGEGKWLVLGKNELLASAAAVNSWLNVDGRSVWGLALPLCHVGGFGVVARAYEADCGLTEYEGKWDPARFCDWVEADCVTHVSLVPTQIHDLLVSGRKGGASLRAVVVGGGSLAAKAGQAARDAGWPVLASYGMTETCSQVATQRMDCLEIPFADCPLELLPIWEADVSAGGLLRLKGNPLFKGVLETGELHVREGEWFTTSDRAEVSGRYIRPLGRVDSLVKVLGELVDVEAVEKRLIEYCGERLDGVEVAVVAMDDARNEHSLVAVFRGESLQAIVDEYNKLAPGPERIARCCEVTDFPRTALGKIRRSELRELCGRGDLH